MATSTETKGRKIVIQEIKPDCDAQQMVVMPLGYGMM